MTRTRALSRTGTQAVGLAPAYVAFAAAALSSACATSHEGEPRAAADAGVTVIGRDAAPIVGRADGGRSVLTPIGNETSCGYAGAGRVCTADGTCLELPVLPADLGLRAATARDGVVLVGGERGSLFRFEGRRVDVIALPSSSDVRALELAEDGSFVAIQADGSVVSVRGGAAEKVAQLGVDAAALTSTARLRDGRLLVVAGSTVSTFDGERTERVTSLPGREIRFAEGLRADDVWLSTGEPGVVHHFVRGATSAVSLPTRTPIVDAALFDDAVVLLAADGSLFESATGASFERTLDPGSMVASALAARAPRQVVIGGDDGRYRVFANGRVTDGYAPTSAGLDTVLIDGDRALLGASDAGELFALEGETLEALGCGARGFVSSLAAIDGNVVLAGTSDGRLVRMSAGGMAKLQELPSAITGLFPVSAGRTMVLAGTQVSMLEGDSLRSLYDGPVSFQAVHGAAADDVWIGGGDGFLVHWDGLGFDVAAPVTDEPIRAISARATDDVWAVTPSAVLHYDGRGWAVVPVGERLDFTGVHVRPTGEVLVAIQGGVLRFEDGDFIYERAPAMESATLFGDARGVFLVGSDGLARRESDGRWTMLDALDAIGPAFVGAMSANDVILGGPGGRVLRHALR